MMDISSPEATDPRLNSSRTFLVTFWSDELKVKVYIQGFDDFLKVHIYKFDFKIFLLSCINSWKILVSVSV